MLIKYYNGRNILLTEIYVSNDKKEVKVTNHAVRPSDNAFGLRPVEKITYEDVYEFLASRTLSPNYNGLKEELRAMKLKRYDPVAMCKVTNGRMRKDHDWLTITE